MLATVIEGFGDRDRLKLMDVPRPDFGEVEVLIRVEVAGIGLWDVKVREGTIFKDGHFPAGAWVGVLWCNRGSW